jgi:hypothetical protein
MNRFSKRYKTNDIIVEGRMCNNVSAVRVVKDMSKADASLLQEAQKIQFFHIHILEGSTSNVLRSTGSAHLKVLFEMAESWEIMDMRLGYEPW